jgi:hypothetical protein
MDANLKNQEASSSDRVLCRHTAHLAGWMMSNVHPEVIRYSADILPLFIGRCDACHGWEPGRFDPNTFEGLIRVVNVDDPINSTIVQMMAEGHHSPGLAPDEIALVIEWIVQGAEDN